MAVFGGLFRPILTAILSGPGKYIGRQGAMPYQTAIRTLAGHGNFQRFEHFITNIALKKYRCSIVEKTIDTDGLLDVLAVSVRP